MSDLMKETLKAWAHWQKKNPTSPGNLEMANAVEFVLTQLQQEREKTKALEAECLEQARLNGIGASREAALEARVAELVQALGCVIERFREVPVVHRAIESLSKLTDIELGLVKESYEICTKALQSDGSFMLRRMEKLEEALDLCQNAIVKAWENGCHYGGCRKRTGSPKHSFCPSHQMLLNAREACKALDRVEEEK